LHITGIDSRDYQPLTVAPNRAVVLVFVLQDCPISNGYAPLIERLSNEFGHQGVRFYLVHVDATISQDAAIKHAKDYGYTIPVLIDRRHELVSRLAVDVAPTVVVLGADDTSKYKGRIDDWYAGIGKPRTVATTHDLRDAIVAVIEGKPINATQTQSIGCAVPDLPARTPSK
jgi:thiol-disulfide isomerase/thioredoxin